MEVNKLSKTREVRLLGQLDIPAILKVCSGNTLYFQYHPPVATAESIAADMQALPPGKRPEDKYYIGFFAGKRLIAVMDLILDYPETATAFIGFFMVETARQHAGIGSRLVAEAADYLCTLGYRKLRLGVDRGNPQSFAFWRKNGFLQVDEGRYIVMERTI